MKKTLRFAALTAVLCLTSWLSMGAFARAAWPSCRVYQGNTCSGTGYVYCDEDPPNQSLAACVCEGGRWNCGW
jgi:hypothetical protein